MSPEAVTALSIAAFWLLTGLGCAAIHRTTRPPLPQRTSPTTRLRQAINDLETCEALYALPARNRKENRP
ncbi:hypothetical protein LUW77_03210 [Streptomyces radiopugnans]|nr:hypothetical protein LUW77_03210 [Streptomyces radiopugnans]